MINKPKGKVNDVEEVASIETHVSLPNLLVYIFDFSYLCTNNTKKCWENIRMVIDECKVE